MILGLGAIAAFTLLVYLPWIIKFRATTITMRAVAADTPLTDYLAMFYYAVGNARPLVFVIWLLLLVSVWFIAFVRVQASDADRQSQDDRSNALFCLLLGPLVCVTMVLFLRANRALASEIYYGPFVAAAGTFVEMAFVGTGRNLWFAATRFVLAIVVMAASIGPLWEAALARHTNFDTICDILNREARPDDLVLVDSFWRSPCFLYYYRGPCPWTTLPDLPEDDESRAFPYTAIPRIIATPNANRPLLQRLEATLRAHRRVWLVGPAVPADQEIPTLPPAPESEAGWNHNAYINVWIMQLERLLYSRRLRIRELDVCFSGWANWQQDNERLRLIEEENAR